jgi:hypothetical protein
MSSGRHHRWQALGLLTVVVLAGHVALLFGVAPAWIDPDDDALPSPPTLSVRSVIAVAPAAAPPPETPRLPAAAAPSRPQRLRTRAASAPLPTAEPATAVAPQLVEPESPASGVEAPVQLAAVSAEAPAAASVVELPTYATRPPAPGQWRYELQRGVAIGEALLRWAPESDGRYALQLEGRIAGVTVMDWVSRGAIDGAGLAPERFVIRRRGRDSQAANFQRDAGKITFSGPTHEVRLLPGVQDRLSWMVQMAAIVQAAPERFGAGSTLTLMVVGARGGVDVWRFEALGVDGAGLKFTRQARRPHDTQVEIWLDPARAYLPLRASLTQPDGGAPFELRQAPDREAPPSTGP